VLAREWQNVMALTAGLVVIKAGIIIALGPLVGLKRSESVRTGFVLSQGGEFAFVVFTLANQLQVNSPITSPHAVAGGLLLRVETHTNVEGSRANAYHRLGFRLLAPIPWRSSGG
jgi:Kef-type K+ transport system membrane component KefB